MLTFIGLVTQAVVACAPTDSHDITPPPAPIYTLIDCGELAGGLDHSEAVGMNEDGTIIGWSWADGGITRAFSWSMSHGMRELDAPPGMTSVASAIADDGSIYGWHGASPTGRAVRWDRSAAPSPIDDLPGGYPHAWVSAATAMGTIVGLSSRVDGSYGFIGTDAAIVPIQLERSTRFVPLDINESGIVVGTIGSGALARPARLSGGRAVDLPMPPGVVGSAHALAIGPNSHVVGSVTHQKRGADPLPVMWYPSGGVTLLREHGPAGANDVDARGNAVGWITKVNETRGVAWLVGIGEVDLTSQSDEHSRTWHVLNAVAINSRGWIAANARQGTGPVRAVLLVPPSSATDFDGSGGAPDDRDFFAWLDAWKNGSLRADLAGPSGVPDGIVDGNDMLRAIELWTGPRAR